MLKTCLLTCLLLASSMLHAQQRIFLYPQEREDIMHKGFDTIAPFMDYYPAPNDTTKAGKTAVLICPGGAYTHLAWEKEGVLPALFFNANGIDAFVLRYRLNNVQQQGHHFPAQYNDATTALRMIREKAAEWHIDPARTGVMGFSAGGHLAATTGTIRDDGRQAPAFLVLVYPVITLTDPFAHKRSREMVTGGAKPDSALIERLSAEKRVTAQTPPTLLIHADDDASVPPQNSILFYEALKKNKVPAAMLIYDRGGHGFGMAAADPFTGQWPSAVVQWLSRQGFR